MTNFEIYTYLKAKKGGGEPVPVPVTNPALRLMDWEGTTLKEYTAEQVASLTALPTPSSLNTNVDRELLSFQGYNWALSDIKSWVTAHEGQCLTVGAIYTTTDGQDHNYWDYPRFDTAAMISVQKRGTASIGNYAFNSCYALKNINIPNSVTSIGDITFNSCFALKNINIPASVTVIGGHAFNSCYALKNINIPNSVTSIRDNAFNSCFALENINIPTGVTTIYGETFRNCFALKNINIPASVTVIGGHAFNSCYALENINIPTGVTTIYGETFRNCFALKNINIPASVTVIGGYAFTGSRVLADIVIQGKPALSNVNAFDNIYSDYLIYVPRAKLSWYSTATNWTTLYNDNKIAAIEDNIEYLESIGIDV